MKSVATSIALAAIVIVTVGPSYAQPPRSTSIPSRLADDEKRLMLEVMNEFYGTFDKEKACWISKHQDTLFHKANRTYCMKPIRLDVIKSTGRKMLFIVAGGQRLDEEGEPEQYHAAQGVFGLIVLTPRGANLGVVATTLYEEFETYGGYPQHDSITIHRLGPSGAYGWAAKLGEDHGGYDIRWVQVYGVIGNSVKPLTTITSYYSDEGRSGCGPEAHCTALSVKHALETHSSASSFYPIILRVSGIREGRPFRGNYRMVFDKNSLTYLAPNNMPDEIKPYPFIALPEPGMLSFACKGTETFGSDKNSDRPVSMGIVVNFTTRTVQFGLYRYPKKIKITGLDDARVAFGEEGEGTGFIGTIDRVTGNTQATSSGSAYLLQCKLVRRMF
jgi:hypothetical protein